MTETFSEYYLRMQKEQEKRNAFAANIVLQSVKTSPDEFAGDLKLAQEYSQTTGAPRPPVEMVQQHRPVFQQKVEEARNMTFLSGSPKLAEWLRNPENAALARDVVPELSWFEGFGRGLANTGRRAAEGLGQMGNQLMLEQTARRARDRGLTFGEILEEESLSDKFTDENGNPIRLYDGSNYVRAFARWVDARYADLIGTDDAAAAQEYSKALAANVERLRSIPKSQIATEFETDAMADGATFGEAIANFAGAAMRNPVGALSWMLETAGETAPQLAAALGTTLLTRNPAAGVAVGAGGAYATERYRAPAEFFEEKGLDLSKPEDIQRLMNDPELMREAAERGVIRGLVIGTFAALSMGVAGQTMARNPLVDALAQGLTQAVTGSSGEYFAQALAGQEIDWNEVLAEGFAEFATTPVDMGIAGRRFIRQRNDAEKSVETQEKLQGALDAAAQSVLRNRAPDRFRDFVARSTEGTDVENVFVDAERFVEYFQEMGVDPFEIAETLDGVGADELRAGLLSGDLRIPLATVTEAIPGSGHEQFFLDNARFDPGDMAASEAAEFNARVEEIRQEMWELAEQQWKLEQEYRTFEQEIRDTVISRLRSAGMGTEYSTTAAELFSAFYRVMAERSGLTVEEFMQRYPLPQIRGDLPEGMQSRNVDALTRTLAEARAMRSSTGGRRGRSLLEFIADRGGIRDVGGDVRSIIGGTEIKRGRGKKTLKIVRDDSNTDQGSMFGIGQKIDSKGRAHGLDDVAQAAIEAGFMSDHPDVVAYKAAMERGDQVPDITRALLDAIDEEMRGNVQRTADDVAEAREAEETDDFLDGIDEYLSRLGVSLDDPDDVIRAAVEADQAERGAMYNQDGTINTESEAFKRWFGDSKVVDDQGNPLVVYHGTNADIERRNFRFSEAAIGSANDGGHYGRGFYFTRYRGEAEFYGPKIVEAYLSIRNPLDLSNETGDLTFAGHFKSWAPKLDAIGALTEEQRQALNAISSADAYVEENITYIRAVSRDGVEGWTARVPNPAEGYTDQIYLRPGFRGEFPSTKEEALENLKSYFRDEMQRHHPEVYPGLGREHASLSDYVRTDLGARALTDAAIAAGHDGIFYGDEIIAFRPEQIKSVHNRGTFDPNDARILYQGAHGSIQFPAGGVADAETIINLFQSRDLSTFLHESGHYFLQVMRDISARGEGNAAADLQAVSEWWRSNADGVAKDAMRARPGVEVSTDDVNAWIDNGTTGDLDKDMAIDIGAHEQFARGFEQYLMEGKAPSVELRSAFEKFRAWLISVYRRLTGLNVQISDEMRAVFDRMLATDEEIAKAQESAGAVGPVFATAEQMGLTEEEYRAFLKMREKAEDEAKAKLLGEIMKPIKRQNEKWFREERAKMREEVEKEINAYRQYRAFEWMANRRWFGDGKPETLPDMRMSKDILVQRYGAGILRTLPRGRSTIYAVDGGLDPDDIAPWFGFSSGDEMVKSIESAPPRVEAIEAETDKRMRDKYGDVLNDGNVEVEALDAIHSERRGEWIAAELKAVSEVAGLDDRALSAKEARYVARQTISRMRVRDAMASNRFLANERKAAEEAARLGRILAREGIWMQNARRRVASKAREVIRGEGSPDAVARQAEQASRSTENYNETVSRLVEAKRRQLINQMLYMESRKLADEVGKAERFVAKLQKRSHREKIAFAHTRENAQVDYLAAIDEILDQYDFRRMSGRAEDRRGALNAFIQAMTDAGRANELAIPDHVLESASRKPYKTLPVEELRGVIDALKNIEHAALRWNEFLVNKKKREFSEATGAIADAIYENVKGKPQSWIREVGVSAGAKDFFSGYIATVMNATTIMRKLDGRKDMGPVYELLKSDMDAAAYQELEMQREAAKKLQEIYDLYTADEQRQMAIKRSWAGLRGQFSKWNLIMMALNMGNEGNLDRLTNTKAKFHLTEQEVEIVKNTLDERDARFVQSVWDLVNSYWPLIEARDKRIKGVAPQKVEAKPVTIGGVELRGGYFPIMYDTRHGGGRPGTGEAQDSEILSSILGGGYASAQTKNGHLKARGAHVRQSLLLDTSVINRHLNQVIHDLAFSEPVVNTWRMLNNNVVEQAFIDTGLQDAYQQLKLWVQDTATGQIGQGNKVAQAMTFLRGGFAYSKLAFSLRTILLQPLGIMQSAVAVGKGRLSRHVLNMLRDPKAMAAEVEGRSKMMQMRRDTFNKDLMDAQAQSNIVSPAGNQARQFMDEVVIPFGMAGMIYTQYYTVDVPTWAAAFEKGMEQFDGDEAKSAQYADMTVQRTQGSGIWTDRSAIERGTLSATYRQSPFVTYLTLLGTYFFAKMNMATERTDALRAQPVTMQSAMNYALDMSLLFLGEAIAIALVAEVYDAMFGDDDDDDDDEDSIAGDILKEGVKTMAAGLPVVRDIASLADGFDAGAYGSILKTIWRPIEQAGQLEFDRALVKSTINLGGMLFRAPSAQINRSIVDPIFDAAEGEDVSPAEYLLGKMKK